MPVSTPPDPKKPATAKAAAASAAGIAPAGAATPPVPQSESMVRSLEQFITTVISEQVTSMLDGADEILFEMANKATDNNEQRLYLDTLRVIRHEKPRLLRTFQDNLKQSFAEGRMDRAASNVDLDDLDSWSLRSADDVEETVAVTNLESKAGSLYQQEIFELENRLETLAQRGGESVSSKLLMPGRIFEAMRDSLKTMEVDFPVKLVVYRLAERTLLSNLRQVYVGANQMLASRGYEAKRIKSPSRPAPAAPQAPARAPAGMPGGEFGLGSGAAGDAPAWAPAGPSGSPEWNPSMAGGFSGGPSMPAAGGPAMNWGGAPAPAPGGAAAWPSGLSAQRLLAGFAPVAGAAVQGATYTDSQLATEMASAINALSHGRSMDTWMPASNLALTGRMFDSLYQDRLLTEEAKPLLHRLQYPVMKTALADPEFFKEPYHPVRKLVHDVFEMLASVAKPHSDDIHRLSSLIDSVLHEFEVSPERLSRPENRAPAVTEEQAAKFLADQEKRIAEHNAHTIEKVRRLVAMELNLRTASRSVPDAIRPLLLSGFGPMLAHNMLRGGIDGIAWKESMELLDRMFDSLDPAKQHPPAVRQAAESAITFEIGQRLLDMGLPNSKVQRLVVGLADAYKAQARAAPPPAAPASSRPTAAAAETPAAAPAPEPLPVETLSADARARAAARHALTSILTVGSWFQVWDSSQNQRRWLKLHQYFPTQDTVVFDDFLGENHLRIRSSVFTHDLIAGRSAPVDPNPTVRRALELLAPVASELPKSSEPPQWMPADASKALH